MFSLRHALVAGLAGLGALAAGCQGPVVARAGMSSVYFDQASPVACFEAAEAVLREFDFPIEVRNPSAGVLRTAPVEEEVRQPMGRLTDPLLHPVTRIRRIAEVQVIPRNGGAEVLLAVRRERLDTATHRAFRQELGGEDRPFETSAVRATDYPAEQEQVWSPAGRDRELERQLRAALAERLGIGEATSQP